jgi:hypothetical protein
LHGATPEKLLSKKKERRLDMTEKKFKEICKCDHCGSEAEMVITCSLKLVVDNAEQSETEQAINRRLLKEKQKGAASAANAATNLKSGWRFRGSGFKGLKVLG